MSFFPNENFRLTQIHITYCLYLHSFIQLRITKDLCGPSGFQCAKETKRDGLFGKTGFSFFSAFMMEIWGFLHQHICVFFTNDAKHVKSWFTDTVLTIEVERQE